MANQILVQFTPSGDKDLINAINKLATAQKKLDNSLKNSTATSNQLNNANRKLDAGMSRLRASFKAQGKSLMDTGVSAELYKKALLGNVIAQEKVRLSVKKYNKDLAEANIATRILGGSVAVLRSKMLVAAFAIGMVKRPFEDLINAYSRATEVGGKFDVVFGETRDVAEQFARSLGKNFGRATTDIKEFMSSLQDTFVPLGFARIQSAKLSAGLTELALDVASFNNKMDADVVRDFQSAIVGNHETVKKYGIIINEATLKQTALAMGLVENVKDLTEYDKVLARVAIMQKGTADAQGDVIRTFDTLANSVKAAQAEFTAFKEEFGEILEPLAMFLLELGELAMNLVRLIKIPLQMLTTVFGAFGQILNSVNIALDGFFSLFKKDVPELDKAKEALNSLNNEIFIFSDGVKKASTPAFSLQVQSLIDSFEKGNAPVMVFSNTMNNLDKMYSQTKQGKAFYLKQQIDELEALGDIGEGYDKLLIVISDLKSEYEGLLDVQIKSTKIIKDNTDQFDMNLQKVDGITIANQNLQASVLDMILSYDTLNEKVIPNLGKLTSAYDQALGSIEANMTAMDDKAKLEELDAANSIKNEERRRQKIDQINVKYEKKAEDRAKKLRAWKVASATSNTALGITQILADPSLTGQPWMKFILSSMVAASGAAQIATIRGEKFEQGGMVGGRRHSQGGTMIEAEQGEFVMSRNAVNAIGVENLNRMNRGGGGAVNITFTGNVMSQDFIENEAIPQIKEAIRRGADIGVS